MSEFNVKTATIVTWDLEQVELIKGKRILYRPAWKWLLGL
jgi:predicted AAA+ superfamily ATPase